MSLWINNRLDWANEFFCSLNVAWIAVAFELWRPQSVIYQIGGWQARHRFWHKISYEPYVVLDQVFWSVILATAIFLILRSLASIWVPGLPFRAVSGIIAISGFPFAVLLHWPLSTIYSISLVQWRFPRFVVSLAVIEIAVSIFCIAFYLFRKWPLSIVPSLILLIAHFGLWAWATGCWADPVLEWQYRLRGAFGLGIVISLLFYFGFPLIGFLSSVTWAREVAATT